MNFLQTEIKIDKNRMRYGIKYNDNQLNENLAIASGAMVIHLVRERGFESLSACHGQIAKWIKACIDNNLKAQVSRLQYASLKLIKPASITVSRLILEIPRTSLDKLVFLLSFKSSKASCLGGFI